MAFPRVNEYLDSEFGAYNPMGFIKSSSESLGKSGIIPSSTNPRLGTMLGLPNQPTSTDTTEQDLWPDLEPSMGSRKLDSVSERRNDVPVSHIVRPVEPQLNQMVRIDGGLAKKWCENLINSQLIFNDGTTCIAKKNQGLLCEKPTSSLSGPSLSPLAGGCLFSFERLQTNGKALNIGQITVSQKDVPKLQSALTKNSLTVTGIATVCPQQKLVVMFFKGFMKPLDFADATFNAWSNVLDNNLDKHLG